MATIDHLSPYYTHASDNPGQVFASELLRDKNYGDWVNEMTNILYAKNKFGFVDDTMKKPKEDKPDFAHWTRCNAMVKGCLNSSMDKEVRASVKYAKTAHEIWVDLKERFGKESAPRAYELRQMVAATRQNKTFVSAYYTKMKSLWEEIQSMNHIPKCTCGKCECNVEKENHAMREKERLYEFLMGLDEEFATVKTQILSSNPLPSVSVAFHLVSEDEQQRMITASRKLPVEAAAFSTQSRGDTGVGQTRIEGGGVAAVAGNWGNNDKRVERRIAIANMRCNHCGKSKHTKEMCFELIGYPEWFPKAARVNEQKKQQPMNSNPTRPPQAASVNVDGCPIPGASREQFEKMMQFFSHKNNSYEALDY